MTGRAPGVVERGVLTKVLMWIMTRQTTDPAVVRIEAAAIAETVRLEADGVDALNVRGRDLHPGAMTGSAEIGDITGV